MDNSQIPDLKDIFQLLEHLARVILRDIHAEVSSALSYKITTQQLGIGLLLTEQGGRLTVTDVANELGVTLSAVTAGANRMSRNGLLRRFRDDADRRVVWMELTDAGLHAVQTYLTTRDRVLEESFACLTGNDRANLYRIMLKLMEHRDCTKTSLA